MPGPCSLYLARHSTCARAPVAVALSAQIANRIGSCASISNSDSSSEWSNLAALRSGSESLYHDRATAGPRPSAPHEAHAHQPHLAYSSTRAWTQLERCMRPRAPHAAYFRSPAEVGSGTFCWKHAKHTADTSACAGLVSELSGTPIVRVLTESPKVDEQERQV